MSLIARLQQAFQQRQSLRDAKLDQIEREAASWALGIVLLNSAVIVVAGLMGGGGAMLRVLGLSTESDPGEIIIALVVVVVAPALIVDLVVSLRRGYFKRLRVIQQERLGNGRRRALAWLFVWITTVSSLFEFVLWRTEGSWIRRIVHVLVNSAGIWAAQWWLMYRQPKKPKAE